MRTEFLLTPIITLLVFGIYYGLMGLELLVSLIVSAGFFSGLYLILAKPKQTELQSEMERHVLKESEEIVIAIRKCVEPYGNPQALALANTVQSFFYAIRETPESIPAARKELMMLLRGTATLLNTHPSPPYVSIETLLKEALMHIRSSRFEALKKNVKRMKRLLEEKGNQHAAT